VARIKPPHRTDIQGLRAVAVLLVVLAHAGMRFLQGGFVGVDVFFVLSGFLITGLLLAEARKNGSVSLLDFYLRRARRIVPAAALTLLVTNVAVLFVMNFVRAREAVHDDLHAAGFTANFRFAARGVDYFAQGDPPSPVLHYWSLAVEEQFYLVWPLLFSLALFGVAVLWRRGRRGRDRRLMAVVLVLTTASLAWSIHLTATEPTTAYFSPFTRGWELGLGATIAVCASTLARIPASARVAMGWAGVAAIGVAAVVFSNRTPFPGSVALLPTVGTALAIIAGMGADTLRLSVGRLLSLRPMLIIGDRSYAFYLWHWPVLILARHLAGHELSSSATLVLVAGAFLLSCASYALVENPIHRKVRGRKTTVLVVAVCMAAVLATAGVSLAGIERAQRRFEGPLAAPVRPLRFGSSEASTARGALPAVIAAVEAARRGEPIPSPLTPRLGELKGSEGKYGLSKDCIGRNRSSVVRTKICRLGNRSSRKVVVLMGDSHALMWLPAVVRTARRDGSAVVPLVRLGCTPAKWTSRFGSDACQEWYRWAISEISRLRPRVTLVGGSIGEVPGPFTQAGIDGVVTAAHTLRNRAVVVIGDPEGLDQDPVDCLLSPNATMATCTTTWPASSLAAYDEIARRVPPAGGGFLSTRGFVCFKRQCPAVVRRTIVWADASSHLSDAYSSQIAAAFRAGLRS
jgi:peptidoglycan/LPS O-acetylase OafA/YrhL